MWLIDKHSALEHDTILLISYRVLMMQSLESVCERVTTGLQLVKKPVLCLSRTILLMQTYRDKSTLKKHTQFMWHRVLSTHQHMYIMYISSQ